MFKKRVVLSLIIIVLLALSMGAAYQSDILWEVTTEEEKEEDELIAVDTLQGTAEGFGGKLVVEVELENDEIVQIDIIEHSESDGISDPAIEKIPEAIIEEQNYDVDAVSEATITSEAIMEAVQNALKDEDWKPEIVALKETDTDQEILEGSAEGHGGELVVEVEVENDEIQAVNIIEHNETDGISDPAIKEIPQSIVGKQDYDVDVVSEATVTSEAIMEAVADALN